MPSQAGSPAINAGVADGAPTVDVENRTHDDQPDIGAYEYQQPIARLYLPLVAQFSTTKDTKGT